MPLSRLSWMSLEGNDSMSWSSLGIVLLRLLVALVDLPPLADPTFAWTMTSSHSEQRIIIAVKIFVSVVIPFTPSLL